VILANGGQYGTQDVRPFCFTGGTPPQQGGTPDINGLAAEDFKVYPNPASDMLHIRWSSELTGTATLLLTDLAGRKIAAYNVNGNQGKNSFDIPLKGLPSGMYLLKLDAGGKQFQQKVMVQQP
jgi:hypothetical protein